MKYLMIILAFVMSFYSLETSIAQWTQTNGPNAANVYSLEENGNDLFTGAEGKGIMYSSNQGGSWRKIGYDGISVNQLAHDGITLFAGIGDRIVKTTDRGIKWDSCSLIPPASCLTAGNGIVAAGTPGNGVFISIDNGSNWSNNNTGLPALAINDIAVCFENIFALTQAGVYRTTNYGEFWSYSGLADYYLLRIEEVNGKLYVSTGYPGNIFVSHDHGNNWTDITNNINGDIFDFESNGLYIFASGQDGIFRSSNGGEQWEYLTPDFYDVHSIEAMGSDVFGASPRWMAGIRKSTDNGGTWIAAMNGIMASAVLDLAVSGDVLYAATETGGVKFTTNRGDDWLSAGMEHNVLTGLAANHSNTYVSTIWDQAGLFRSSDRGANWYHIGSGDAYDISAFAVTNELVYVSTRNPHRPGLFMSTDNGLNWVRIGNYMAATLMYARNNELIACSPYFGMVCTTNHGAGWITMSNGAPFSFANAMIGKDSMIFAGLQSIGVYATSNYGANWIPLNNGLTVLNINCFTVYGSKLFAGTTDGVFVTTNNGVIWREISEGLGIRDISSLSAVSGYLYAAAGTEGVWRLLIETPLPAELTGFSARVVEADVLLEWTTSSEANNSGFEIERRLSSGSLWNKVGYVEGNGNVNTLSQYSFIDKNLGTGRYHYRLKQIDLNGNFECFELPEAVTIGVPDKYLVDQNYPNPFNPLTTIAYGIPQSGNITLKIFDMAGREIKTLVNVFRDAGYYVAKFDGSSLASGTYIYRIESGSFVSAKKMILLK